MTSMPASRRERAMTFAPRSWPSRPGLAIRTRSFLDIVWDPGAWGLYNRHAVATARRLERRHRPVEAGPSRRRSSAAKMRLDRLGDASLGLETLKSRHRLTADEHDESRQAQHLEAHGRLDVQVGVDMNDFDPGPPLGRQFLHQRIEFPAGMAPLGPEIDQDRNRLTEDLGLERRVGDFRQDSHGPDTLALGGRAIVASAADTVKQDKKGRQPAFPPARA